MHSANWNEKVEVISGLLDQQLALIDSQLESAAAGSGQQAITKALGDIRELCSFTRDLVSTLPRQRPRWWIGRLWRSGEAILG